MSEHEALDYVDLVIKTLVQWGKIDRDTYGKMTENERHALAIMVAAKSEE